jgi:hypothetical protein
MSEQEFQFLEAYAALCQKFGMIITANASSDGEPFMCGVMQQDIPLHIGQLFCPDHE